jgi:hypothetical protein
MDGPEASPAPQHDTGSVARLAGDLTLAKRQLARLAALEGSNKAPLVRASRLLLEGEIALHERRAADAARLQDEALSLRPWHLYSRARAEAREALGDWANASEAWRALLHARGQVLQDGFPPDLAIARDRLARADARLKLAANGKDH